MLKQPPILITGAGGGSCSISLSCLISLGSCVIDPTPLVNASEKRKLGFNASHLGNGIVPGQSVRN